MSELATPASSDDFLHAEINPRYQRLKKEIEEVAENKIDSRTAEEILKDVGLFIEEANAHTSFGTAVVGKLNLLNNLYRRHYELYCMSEYLPSYMAHG